MPLTLAEVVAEMPAGNAKTYWENANDFPAEAEAPECLIVFLTAAAVAANKKNENLEDGNKIASFPFPDYSATSIDRATGLESQVKTCTVSVRVAIGSENVTHTRQ